MRAAIRAATRYEIADNRFVAKKICAVAATDRPNVWNSHSASSDWMTSPPAKASTLNRAASRKTMPRDAAERRGGFRPLHRGIGRQPAVDQPDQEADRGVGEECQLVQGDAIDAGQAGKVVGDDRQQRAAGAQERAHHAIAGKEVGALPVGDGAAERRLLQWQKDADVARRRIERADEGDEHERTEADDRGESNPRRHHQETGRQQQRPNAGVGSVEADGQR